MLYRQSLETLDTMKKKIKPIQAYFKSSNMDHSPSKLQRIVAHANLLSDFENSVQKFLDETLRPYCHVLNYRDHQLILGASGVWLTKIRFELPTLHERLSKRYPNLATIKVKSYWRDSSPVPPQPTRD